MSDYGILRRQIIQAMIDELNAAGEQPPITHELDLDYDGPPWQPADRAAFDRARVLVPILQRELDEMDGKFTGWLTPAEAALISGTAESGWRNRAAQGKIPGATKKGKQWLIPSDAIG